jgi:hypothetical protein
MMRFLDGVEDMTDKQRIDMIRTNILSDNGEYYRVRGKIRFSEFGFNFPGNRSVEQGLGTMG